MGLFVHSNTRNAPYVHWRLVVLTAPLEHSTCLIQRSLLSLKMRSKSSCFDSTLRDLTVVIFFGLLLQICLIMALSLHCRSIFTCMEHGAWHPRALNMAMGLVRKVGGCENCSSSLHFFQAGFTRRIKKDFFVVFSSTVKPV